MGARFSSRTLNKGACPSSLPLSRRPSPGHRRLAQGPGSTARREEPRLWGQSLSVCTQLSPASHVASEEGQAASSEAAISEWAWALGLLGPGLHQWSLSEANVPPRRQGAKHQDFPWAWSEPCLRAAFIGLCCKTRNQLGQLLCGKI